MVKAVILDLDGVFFIETEYLSKRVEEKYGLAADDFYAVFKEVMKEARQPGVADTFVLLAPHFKRWGLVVSREEFFNLWFSGETYRSEVVDYVQELRQRGLKVFILSNNFRERTEYYRQHYPEVFSSVDKTYFSWETGFVKPDLQAFRNLLEEQSLTPEECVYLDDMQKNVESAQEVGIKAALYEDLAGAKEFIASS